MRASPPTKPQTIVFFQSRTFIESFSKVYFLWQFRIQCSQYGFFSDGLYQYVWHFLSINDERLLFSFWKHVIYDVITSKLWYLASYVLSIVYFVCLSSSPNTHPSKSQKWLPMEYPNILHMYRFCTCPHGCIDRGYEILFFFNNFSFDASTRRRFCPFYRFSLCCEMSIKTWIAWHSNLMPAV